jgi:phosphatidylserine/phosphatidylglycerophosphate/cardiolipin synthase-like enzyme
VVKEIGHARERILVQAYSFTSPPIAQALAEAHRRGIHVEVILDKSQRTERASTAEILKTDEPVFSLLTLLLAVAALVVLIWVPAMRAAQL